MRKRLWILLSAVVIVVAVVFLLWHGHHRPQAVEAAPGPPAAQVAATQRGSIAQVLTLAGQFQAYQVVDVHPKVSGFIRHIYVDIGDHVHQGQTLAELEVPELSAQLQGTVSRMASTQDDVTRAQHEVARAESMHAALHAQFTRLKGASAAQPGLVAEQELDDSRAKDLSSEAQVDAAKAALSAAEETADVAQSENQRVKALFNYSHVIAPLDGIIVQRFADTGALIQAGTNSDSQSLPVVQLAQSGLLRLRVPVPEDDVRFVHIGDMMQVRVDAVNRSFTGKVVRFTRDISPVTRTMETEIDVENQNLTLDPGMYANTQLQLDHVSDVPTVPQEAVVQEGKHDVVYVLDNHDRVHVRPVTVGLEGSLLVQIASGLRPGERVIIGAQNKYHEGQQVSPVLTPEPVSDTVRAQGSMVDLHAQQGSSH